MKIQREILKRITTVILLAITVFVLMLAINEYRRYNEKKEIANIQDNFNSNKTKELILLVGTDINDIQEDETIRKNNNVADFIMLFPIDKIDKTITPLIINKDILCEYNTISKTGQNIGIQEGKLCDAYSIGDGMNESLINLKKAIEGLFKDVEITYYMSLNKDTIANINDSIGGVEVVVVDDLTEYDQSLSVGEKVTLKGNQAKIYLKERINVDNNVTLSSRQTQYLHNFFSIIKTKYNENKNFISDIYMKNVNDINSNCSKYDIDIIFNYFMSYQIKPIENIQGKIIENNYKLTDEEIERVNETLK